MNAMTVYSTGNKELLRSSTQRTHVTSLAVGLYCVISATNTATHLKYTNSNTECYCVIMYALVGHETNKWRDFAERFRNTLSDKCNLILPEYKVVLTD